MLHRESFPLDSHAHTHTSVYSLKSPTFIPNSHYGSGCISLRWLSKLSNVKAPSTLSTIFPFASINNVLGIGPTLYASITSRSEEHTSELQSRGHLVCRLLLEKKKKTS